MLTARFNCIFCWFCASVIGLRAELGTISDSCSLSPAVETVIQLQHQRFVHNNHADVCIISTNNSTLDQTHPTVKALFISNYPTKFVTEKPIVSDIRIEPKLASIVLLDATGWEQFPVQQFTHQFSVNPCHFIDARFIVLVTRSCFSNDRRNVIQFLNDQGILNYAIIPMPSSASVPVHNISVYTENRFSNETIFVQLGDLHNLHRIYPNKLTNFHGYTVFMEIIRDDFPYIRSYIKGYYSGVIQLSLNYFKMQFLNLSFYYIDPNFKSNQPEVQFGLITQQDDFQQQIVFREMTGMCLVCPEKIHRYFSARLMIPFSIEFSILLGTMIICCTLLRLLFPGLFRFDPLCFILFGAYRTACNHNLYTQLLLFLFAILSFFLAKAYNSQILSLISFRKIHTRSNTIDEFMQSDYMVLAYQNQRSQFIEDILGTKLLSPEDVHRLSGKFGVNIHHYYCSLQTCCDAFELSSIYAQEKSHPIYTVKEKLVSDIFRFQFVANSPFATVWKRYFGWINDAGLWNHEIQYVLNFMRVSLKAPTPPLSEVLFTFEYLMTVWQLLAIGWMISFAVFFIEYFSVWKIFTNNRYK
uniref:Uncharacterized protein n=1 Tax=Anopheles gambiae TaxID=7165 RepID=A0A2Y9D2A7_ANOGA